MNKKKIAAALTIAIGMTMVPAVNSQAAVYNGWEKNGSFWYYYSNGSMKTGWIYDGGAWYYLNSDGKMASGWKKINGTWYLLNQNGAMETGWVNQGETWYFLNDDGSMKTGWLNNGGTWYYLNSNGSMKIGWLNDGGTWYYLNNDGSMKTGWLEYQGKCYYLNSNGAMQTGWFKDSGDELHYSYDDGAIADEDRDDLFSLQISTDSLRTNADKITVTIENKTDHDYTTEITDDFLQVYNDEKSRWVTVSLKDSAKKDRKITIKAHSKEPYTISVADLESGKLESGFYRVYIPLGIKGEYLEYKVKEPGDISVYIPYNIYYGAGDKNSWMCYTVSNDTDKKITVGSEYSVQKYIDGEWKNVPLKTNDFTEGAFTVEPHSISENKYIRIDNLDEKEHSGKYRFIKTINGEQVYDEVYLSEIMF